MSGELSVSQNGELSESTQSWTDAKQEECGRVLVAYAKALESRLAPRLVNWEIFAAVYSEQLETKLRPSRRRKLTEPSATRNGNLTFNLGRSLVETEHANITEAEPRPTFIVEDGNREDHDCATELQAAIDGVMSDLRGYDTIARCELDKCVLGTGVTKIHAVNGRPAIDRVLISDILIDEELMGPGEDPPQVIHRQEVPRAAMLVYAKKWGANDTILKAIQDAPALMTSGIAGRRNDLIAVYDAYSKPIDDENPGRHAIAIENCDEALLVEEWKSPRLPFLFQRWQRPTTGFYGIGIIEQVLGIQIEINKFYRNVSKALTRWGGVTAFIPTQMKLDTTQWTNAPEGKFIPYDGTGGSVTMITAPKLSSEVEWLNWQIENGYRVTGIPQNTAFAEREPGIPSAEGQRQMSKKAASRLAPQSKQFEATHVNAAWLLDDVLRKLRADEEELVISTATDGSLHKVNVDKAISLKPGTYKIDIFAGNLLSRHPATRREEIKDLANAKIFDNDELRALLGGASDIKAALGKRPDIKGYYQKQIKRAIDKGEATRPESFWRAHLPVGVQLYSDALFEAQSEGVPEARLQVLRDWLTAANDIMSPPGAPPPAQTAPQQTMPANAPAQPMEAIAQ